MKKKKVIGYKKKTVELVNILKKVNPEKIILFGSVGRSEACSDSDIDICVIKKTKSPSRIYELIWELFWESDFNWEIEPDIKVYPLSVYQDYLERQDPFIKQIEKGEVLYEKK